MTGKTLFIAQADGHSDRVNASQTGRKLNQLVWHIHYPLIALYTASTGPVPIAASSILHHLGCEGNGCGGRARSPQETCTNSRRNISGLD